MKIRNSLKALMTRHRANKLVRRRGRVYIINKVQKRFKARQEAKPGGEALRAWIDACPNSLYSALVYKGGEGWLMTFATYLFTHNSQIAIFAFALGFAFAVPTILLILYNGLMLGAFFGLPASPILGWPYWATILFAIGTAGVLGAKRGMVASFLPCGRATRSPVTTSTTAPR